MACSNQYCCLKCLDDIILFGMLIITGHGKQLHQAGGLSVNIAKLHKLLKYSGLQSLHGEAVCFRYKQRNSNMFCH